MLKSVAIIVAIYYNNRVRDALHSYLNLAEATKIRLHAEFNTLSFMAGCFRFVKEENTMTWRIVHVCQSEKMQLKLDNLLIKKMGQDYIIPLSDISIIVAEGGETVVTLRLLSALSKYNIALIVCDNEHLPTGIYHSQNGHFRAYKKLQEQKEFILSKQLLRRILIVYNY